MSGHTFFKFGFYPWPIRAGDMMMTAQTRRTTLAYLVSIALLPATAACSREAKAAITVHKDPNCGCCSGWIKHLERAGFKADVRHGEDLAELKKRLGVPDDLASCHTAEVGGYIIEGHVPAEAILKLLAEKPNARGLAVPGMPIGSPGMEGADPTPYDVTLFGAAGNQRFMRFLESRAIA